MLLRKSLYERSSRCSARLHAIATSTPRRWRHVPRHRRDAPRSTIQNGVEGLIAGLHDFLHDGIGITEGSWGLSIILFTAFLRTLIFPLNYISYEATDRNKALKPYMDKIRERYAEDQQSMNLATAKLYEMTETNPSLVACRRSRRSPSSSRSTGLF